MKNLKLYFEDVRGFNVKLIFELVMEVVFSVLVIVLTSIMPSFIVSYLTQYQDVSYLMMPLAVITSILVIGVFISFSVTGRFASDAIGLRLQSFSSKMSRKYISMDYDLAESDDLMKSSR